MAGETAKTEAVCLKIFPWSRTSHVVSWYTPAGKVSTVVKGAVRPKSQFLGQYDLNYTCEIVHYLGGKGDMRPLRECTPLDGREALRTNYRALLVAEHFREIVHEIAPSGPDAADWYELLTQSLDELSTLSDPIPPLKDPNQPYPTLSDPIPPLKDPNQPYPTLSDPIRPYPTLNLRLLQALLHFELSALRLAGLDPASASSDGFLACGERQIPVPPDVARCLRAPYLVKYTEILLEAVRITGIFWAYHLEDVPPTRRAAVQTISATEQRGTQDR